MCSDLLQVLFITWSHLLDTANQDLMALRQTLARNFLSQIAKEGESSLGFKVHWQEFDSMILQGSVQGRTPRR